MTFNLENYSVAVHEAGHAVVAAFLGVPFKYVTTQPTKDIDAPHLQGFDEEKVLSMKAFVWNNKSDTFRRRSEEEVQVKVSRRLIKWASFHGYRQREISYQK
jgi:hypothetical protein